MLCHNQGKDGCEFFITDRKFGFYLWEVYLPNYDKPIKKGLTRSILEATEKIHKTHQRIVDSMLTEFTIDKDG